MCNPLMALAAGATVGGHLLNSKADQQSQAAQQDTLRAANARQRGFEQESYDKQAKLRADEYTRQDANFAQANKGFGDTLQKVGADQTKVNLNEAMDRRAASNAAAIDVPIDPAETMTGNQPQVIQDAVAKNREDSLTRGREGAQRLGRANGFGDVALQIATSLGRGAENQQALQGSRVQSGRLANEEAVRQEGLYRTKAADYDSITPLELQQASQKGGKLRMFGDILKGGGQLAGFAGAMGAGPSWGSMFGGGSPGFSGAGGQSARFLAGGMR